MQGVEKMELSSPIRQIRLLFVAEMEKVDDILTPRSGSGGPGGHAIPALMCTSF